MLTCSKGELREGGGGLGAAREKRDIQRLAGISVTRIEVTEGPRGGFVIKQ